MGDIDDDICGCGEPAGPHPAAFHRATPTEAAAQARREREDRSNTTIAIVIVVAALLVLAVANWPSQAERERDAFVECATETGNPDEC